LQIQKEPPKETHLSNIKHNAAFLSVIFAENPLKIDTWLKGIQFTGVAREIVEKALWLSGNVKIIKKVFKIVPDYAKSSPPPSLLEIEITRCSDLSFLLGACQDAYVEKVINLALDQKNIPEDKELQELAIWYLGDGAISDLKIRRILVRQLRKCYAKSKKSTIPTLTTTYTHPVDYEYFMWGAFLITGEDQYLQKIFDIIDKTKDFQNQKIIEDVKLHLSWLADNDLLYEIFSKSISTRSENTRKELERILKVH
jgi:hypothetical protein